MEALLASLVLAACLSLLRVLSSVNATQFEAKNSSRGAQCNSSAVTSNKSELARPRSVRPRTPHPCQFRRESGEVLGLGEGFGEGFKCGEQAGTHAERLGKRTEREGAARYGLMGFWWVGGNERLRREKRRTVKHDCVIGIKSRKEITTTEAETEAETSTRISNSSTGSLRELGLCTTTSRICTLGFGAQQIRIMLARLGGLACAGTGAATAKASSTLGVKARPSGLRRVNHFRATLLAAPHIWAAASALQTKQITTSTTTMSSQVGAECAAPSANLEVASWNIAAINNNPFEYWISYDNDDYNCLMADVQRFIKNPGEDDVAVSEIITDDKFADLKELMETYGWKDLDAVESRWREEYRDRKIVSEFLKDKEIGNKRLASMLDRVTNTINLADGSKAFRPTPINCYAEKFSSFDEWWSHWTNFMFKETIEVRMKGETKQVLPADLLLPIKRSKYPAISEEEEAISLPLQTVCAAAFDGILVHMLNKVSGEAWQDLRKQLSEALNMRKNERTMEILEKTYGSSDVVFLQEVAGAFVSQLEAHPVLSQRFAILAPVTSGKRDQLSVILANKEIFDIEAAKDVSDAVSAKFPAGKDVPVAEGDLVASLVPLRNSEEGAQPFLLASFHGDTNGLATIPVVQAVHDYVSEDLDNKATLLFGLDANTYENSTPGKTQDVLEFGEFYVKQGFTSTWGDKPKADEYTTFNARTFLQPQLNKAVTKEEVRAKGDVNPKDFILFYKNQMAAESSTVKDNTGERSFVEDVFPTLTFPSDHAVISAKVKTI